MASSAPAATGQVIQITGPVVDIEFPAGEDEVLVRVHASSVNPVDWHTLTGDPYLVRLQGGLLKPKTGMLGVDFAGTVESVGRNVQRFRPGDEVFGGRSGAFAEYVCVRQDRAVVPKPDNVTFDMSRLSVFRVTR